MEDNFIINEDNLKKLYGIAQSKGMPDSYEDLKDYLSQSEDNRKKFYDKMSSLGMPDSYEDYSAYIGRVDVSDVEGTQKPPFEEWYKTVPADRNDTTSYNLQRAYELAPMEELEAWRTSSVEDLKAGKNHLRSAYENPETGEYEFVKRKDHPTLQMELDEYEKDEEFKKKYRLDKSGDYYKYIPRENDVPTVTMEEADKVAQQPLYDIPTELTEENYLNVQQRAKDLKEKRRRIEAQLDADTEMEPLTVSQKQELERQLRGIDDEMKDLGGFIDEWSKTEGSKAYLEKQKQTVNSIDERINEKYRGGFMGFLDRLGAGMVNDHYAMYPKENGALVKDMLSENHEQYQLKAAKNEVRNAKKQLKLEDMRQNGELKGLAFIRGLETANYYELLPVEGLTDAAAMLELKKAIAEGRELTETEQLLYEAMEARAGVDFAYEDNNTIWERVGQSAPEQLAFTLQFVLGSGLTGATATGERIAAKQAQKAAIRYAKKGVNSGARRFIGGTVIPKLEGMAVSSTIQTFANPLSLANMAEDFERRYAGDIYYDNDGNLHVFDNDRSAGQAAYQAIASAWIENFTEYSGQNITKSIRLADGKMFDLAGKFDNVMKNVGGGRIKDVFTVPQKLSHLTQIGSAPEEFLEEELGSVMNALFATDAQRGESYGDAFKRTISQSFSGEQQLETLLSVTITSTLLGGGGNAVNAVGNAGYRREVNREVERSKALLGKVHGINIAELDNQIENGQISDIASYLKEQSDANGWSQDEQGAAVSYVLNRARQIGIKHNDDIAIEEAQQEMRKQAEDMANRWDGNIYNATWKDNEGNEQPVTIINGRIHYTTRENGTIHFNPYTSSGMIAIRLADGTKKQVPSRTITDIQSVMSVDEQLEAQGNTIPQMMQAQFEQEGMAIPTVESVWGGNLVANETQFENGKYTFLGQDQNGLYAFANNDKKTQKDNPIVYMTERQLVEYGLSLNIQSANATGDTETAQQAQDDLDFMQHLDELTAEATEKDQWEVLKAYAGQNVGYDENGNLTPKSNPQAYAPYLLACSEGSFENAIASIDESIAVWSSQVQQQSQSADVSDDAAMNAETHANMESIDGQAAGMIDFYTNVRNILLEMQQGQQEAIEESLNEMPVSQMEVGQEFPVMYDGQQAVAAVVGKDADGRNVLTIRDQEGNDLESGIDDWTDKQWESVRAAIPSQQTGQSLPKEGDFVEVDWKQPGRPNDSFTVKTAQYRDLNGGEIEIETTDGKKFGIPASWFGDGEHIRIGNKTEAEGIEQQPTEIEQNAPEIEQELHQNEQENEPKLHENEQQEQVPVSPAQQTFDGLVQKYGDKAGHKIDVTAEDKSKTLDKAKKALEKAQTDYDDAPIGKEEKAEAALQKAQEEYNTALAEKQEWDEVKAVKDRFVAERLAAQQAADEERRAQAVADEEARRAEEEQPIQETPAEEAPIEQRQVPENANHHKAKSVSSQGGLGDKYLAVSLGGKGITLQYDDNGVIFGSSAGIYDGFTLEQVFGKEVADEIVSTISRKERFEKENVTILGKPVGEYGFEIAPSEEAPAEQAPEETTEETAQEPVEQPKEKKKPVKKESDFQKRLAAVGEPRTLEEAILYDIAVGGAKFRWGNRDEDKKVLKRGIGDLWKYSQSEFRSRIGIISKDGFSIETYVEAILAGELQPYSEAVSQKAEQMDAHDLTAAVEDVLQMVTTRKQALEAIEEKRRAEADEEQRYIRSLQDQEAQAQGFENWDDKEAYQQSLEENNLTDADYEEINRIFAEQTQEEDEQRARPSESERDTAENQSDEQRGVREENEGGTGVLQGTQVADAGAVEPTEQGTRGEFGDIQDAGTPRESEGAAEVRDEIERLKAKRADIIRQRDDIQQRYEQANGLFGDTQADENDLFGGQNFLSPELAQATIDGYNRQIRQIDERIAKLEASLKRAGEVKQTEIGEATEQPEAEKDAFKAWFGDWENDPQNASKVVDADGKPMVVYHSYDRENYDSGLVFMSKDKNFSKEFGENTDAVYVNLRNPYIAKDGILRDADGNEIMFEGEPASIGYLDSVPSEYLDWLQSNYDGVMDEEGTFIVAFSPDQIRRAEEPQAEQATEETEQPTEQPEAEQKKASFSFNPNTALGKTAIVYIQKWLDELGNANKGKRGYKKLLDTLKKIAKTNGRQDFFAVFNEKGEMLGVGANAAEAYGIALNHDEESFNVVRQTSTDNGTVIGFTNGWLFTNDIPESEWRDDSGRLKQDVKDASIARLAKELEIEGENTDNQTEQEQQPAEQTPIELTDKENATLDKFNAFAKREREIKQQMRDLLGEPTKENYDKATDEIKAQADALLAEYRHLADQLPKEDLLELKKKVWAMMGQASRRYEADDSKENANELNRWANLDSEMNVALRDHYGDKNLYMGDVTVPFREEMKKEEKAETEPKKQPKAPSKAGSQKIDDVGEKIAGARKDMRREIAKGIGEATVQSLVELPFSKAFKKPNLKKAVESGALREEDAFFFDAWLASTVNTTKPKVTQQEVRRKKYNPNAETNLERWAKQTFEALDFLKTFVEADETERDRIISNLTSEIFPKREAQLAEFERIRELNKGRNDNITFGDCLTPNPVWVTYQVMQRLGYTVGDKLDIPFGILRGNTTGTSYYLYNTKDEHSTNIYPNSLEEGIDAIVWLAKIKRGDTDIQHPVSAFYTTPTKSEMGDSGRFRVIWGGWSSMKNQEFDSKEEAEAFAAKKKDAYVNPIQEVKRRFGYKIMFRNPLTGERTAVSDMEFDTKAEAEAYMDGNYEAMNDGANEMLAKESGTKREVTADDVVGVTVTYGKDGWQYAAVINAPYANNMGMPLVLQEFKTRGEAKAYAESVKDKVFETYKQYKAKQKEFVYFSQGEDTRIGEDYRGGKDVTAEDFMNTFGFRGVQFGNWTNQADRQMAVNQAYDAFMDLAKLIGMSPKAMSLNGELGIAFGARGSGNANAHYEYDEVVINLTKTRGAGSLAHEWWHALDNYFARRGGMSRGMVTDVKSIAMRDELRKAYDRLIDEIEKSNYYKRSVKKGDYWGRMHEVTARLLAEWVNRELKQKGELNTFLARGVDTEKFVKMNYELYKMLMDNAGREAMPFEEYKELDEALSGMPYPSDKEIDAFSDALRNIFETIEEREEEGKVVLFDIDNETDKTNETNTEAKELAYNTVRQALANAGIEVEVATEEEVEKMKAEMKTLQDSKGVVRGWVGNDGKIHLTKDGLNAETPIHEYTHLWAEVLQMTNPDLWEQIKGLLKGTPEWQRITSMKEYSNLKDDDRIAGEVLAHISGKKNAERMEAEAKRMIDEAPTLEEAAKAASLLGRMRDALKKFWTWVGKTLLGKKGNINIDQVSNMVLADLTNGVDPFNPRGGKRTNRTKRTDASIESEMERIKSEAQANGTFMKAPNGKPTKLTDRQWLQVRTQAFKKWFGDWENDPENASKVVDENGEPMVVYHGTNVRFNIFKYGDLGFHFGTQEQAEKAAEIQVKWNQKGNERIIGVFLNIRNPFMIDYDPGTWADLSSRFLIQLKKEGIIDKTDWDKLDYDQLSYSKMRSIREKLQDAGYDGVIYPNWFEFNVGEERRTEFDDSYIAFNPNQIKSATDNNGEFDAGNPDIRFSIDTPESSRMEVRDEFDELSGAHPTEKAKTIRQKYEQLLTDQVNKFRPLKQLEEILAEKKGRKLRDSESFYSRATKTAARTLPQMEAEKEIYLLPLEQAVNEVFSVLDPDGNRAGRRTKQEEGGRENETMKQLRQRMADYLIAKHGLERNDWFHQQALAKDPNAQEEDKSGLRGLAESLGENPDDYKAVAEQVVKDFEAEVGQQGIDNLWKELNGFTNRLLEMSYNDGFTDKDHYDELKGRWKHYVPLRGFADGTSDDMYYYTTQGGDSAVTMMKAKGRTSKADDPLTHLVRMQEKAVTAGNDNWAKTALYNAAINLPSDLLRVKQVWYTEDPNTGEIIEHYADLTGLTSPDDIDAAIKQFNADMKAAGAKRRLNKADVGKRIRPQNLGEHEIEVWVNGKKIIIEVNGNPSLVRAYSESQDELKGFIKGVQKANRLEARLFTTWNPEFAVKNMMRDTNFALFSAFVIGGTKQWNETRKNIHTARLVLPKLMKDGTVSQTLVRDAADRQKLEQWYKEFIENGGETGFTRTMNAEQVSKDINDTLRAMAKGNEDGVTKMEKLAGAIEDLNRWAENSTRFAAYITARERGETVTKAMDAAKNSTLNFNIKGYEGKRLRAWFCFFNARLQGVAQLARLAKENPKRFAIGLGAAVLTGAMLPFLNTLLLGLGGDDDDWKTYEYMSEYTGNNNFVLFIPGIHKFVAIPYAQELAPFSAIGNIWFREAMGWNRNKSAWQQELEMGLAYLPMEINLSDKEGTWPMLGSTVARSVSPTIMQPIVEYAVNENFMNMPLRKDSKYKSELAAWTQAYENRTSGALIKASKWLNGGGSENRWGKAEVLIDPSFIQHVVEGTAGGVGSFIGNTRDLFTEPDWFNHLPFVRKFMFDGDPKKWQGGLDRAYSAYAYDFIDERDKRIDAIRYDNQSTLDYARQMWAEHNSTDKAIYDIAKDYRDNLGKYKQKVDGHWVNMSEFGENRYRYKDNGRDLLPIIGIKGIRQYYNDLRANDAEQELIDEWRGKISEYEMQMVEEIEAVYYRDHIQGKKPITESLRRMVDNARGTMEDEAEE